VVAVAVTAAAVVVAAAVAGSTVLATESGSSVERIGSAYR
jgi:hypothetical protein